MITFTVSCPGPNIVLPDAISKPIIGSYLFQVSESVESLVRSVRRKLSRCIFRSPSIVLSRKEQIAFCRLTCHFPSNRSGEGGEQGAASRDILSDVDRALPAVDVVAINRLSESAADAEHVDESAYDSKRRYRLDANPLVVNRDRRVTDDWVEPDRSFDSVDAVVEPVRKLTGRRESAAVVNPRALIDARINQPGWIGTAERPVPDIAVKINIAVAAKDYSFSKTNVDSRTKRCL
jgi:hypothetical protein